MNGACNWKFRKWFGFPFPEVNTWTGKWRIEHGRAPEGRKLWRRGEDYYWSRVRDVQKSDAEEFVYDVVMDCDPHSYVVAQGVVHNSEYGRICEKEPEKAAEIKRAALNTVAPDQYVFIESTGRGGGGDFQDMCEQWRIRGLDERKPLTDMDYKFWFFPWFKHNDYATEPGGVEISEKLVRYFKDVERMTGAVLTDGQKAWYASKEREQKDKMWGEYPSVVEEAFSTALEGAYYGPHIWTAREEGRVGDVQWEPSLPVHTAWDLGVDNATVIVFFQLQGKEVRFIHCEEGSGEGLRHYADLLWKLRHEYGWEYGRFFAPHDIAVREFTTGRSRLETALDYGISFEVAPKLSIDDGIEAVWAMLPHCWFDVRRCAKLLDALSKYRREKDGRTGLWKSSPFHDWTSNFADSIRVAAICRGVGNGFSGSDIADKGAA